MNTLDALGTALAMKASAVPGAWDLGSFLTNATSSAKNWISLGIMLLGVVMLGMGAFYFFRKLTASQQTAGQQKGYMTIIALVLVGGAFMSGGFTLMDKVGSGGQKTIEELGGGTAIVQVIDATQGADGVWSVPGLD